MAAWLSGKKTYLTAAAGAAYGLLVALKIVANEPPIWAIIASGNIASWRAALGKTVSKSVVAVETAVPAVDTIAIQAAVAAINTAIGPYNKPAPVANATAQVTNATTTTP